MTRRHESRQEVVVTGVGLVTPAGAGADETWKRLCEGTPTAAADPVLAGLPVSFSCAVADEALAGRLERRLAWRLDRFAAMGLIAGAQALSDSGLGDGWDRQRCGVVLGVGSNSLERYEGGYAQLLAGHPEKLSPLLLPRSVPNMAAGELAARFQLGGPNFTTSSACASGATALGVAAGLIRSGVCDVVLAGGTESGRTRTTAACFWRMGALSTCDDPGAASRPFDAGRDGFVLGEGAAVLVLESISHAQSRGARPYATIVGYGASADAYHPTTPDPDGRGAVAAMRAALADADLASGDIDHVNAHGTSTKAGDLAEARALRAVFACPPPVTANKSVLGHALGAAGAIEAACAVLTLHHGAIPPTANLDKLDPEIDLDIVTAIARTTRPRTAMSCSFGFGGQNAVLIFERAS